MKRYKSVLAAAAAVVLMLTLTSCNMTAIFGKIGVTAPATFEGSTTAAPSGTESVTDKPSPTGDPIDALDLTQYMSLEYKGLTFEVDKLPAEPTDEQVDTELREILLYYEKYGLSTERETRRGDTIEMSYSGTVDGQPLDGGQSDKATILLDEFNSGYIPGFAEGLVGVTPGTTVTLNLTFPENYYAEIAGKAVVFDVTVKGICTFELTDTIASELSTGAYPTAAAYREHLKEYLKEAEEMQVFSDLLETILDTLMEKAVVTVYPADVLEKYYQTRVAYILETAQSYNISYDEYMQYCQYTDETLREFAKEDTKLDMVLYYVSHAENLPMTDEEYRGFLEDIVASYTAQGLSVSADYIEQYYDAYYGAGYLRRAAFQEKIAHRVYELATLVEAPDDTQPAA